MHCIHDCIPWHGTIARHCIQALEKASLLEAWCKPRTPCCVIFLSPCFQPSRAGKSYAMSAAGDLRMCPNPKQYTHHKMVYNWSSEISAWTTFEKTLNISKHHLTLNILTPKQIAVRGCESATGSAPAPMREFNDQTPPDWGTWRKRKNCPNILGWEGHVVT